MTAKVKHISGRWNRGVVIGDIHGCLSQLKAILRKVNFSNAVIRAHPEILDESNDSANLVGSDQQDCSSGDDLCIFVGDLINKGPDSYGCVRFLRALGAIGVSGNHDLKLVSLRNNMDRGIVEESSSLFKLAKDCPPDVLEYLENLPHIVHISQWNVIVVHAGLDPSVPLQAQNVEVVTRMRRLRVKDSRDEVDYEVLHSSDYFDAIEKGKCGIKWFKMWKQVVHDKKNFSGQPIPVSDELYYENTVVYGHDAKSSLQERKFTIGLDSGCVYGRSLSALLLPTRKIIQIPGYQHL